MRNEIVLSGFNSIIRLCHNLNAVEYVKWLAIWGYGRWQGRVVENTEKRAVAGLVIDVFLLSKFALVIFLIAADISGAWAKYICYYLISANVFTYFYYHVWGSQFQQFHDQLAQRRRFVNFILAILFYLLSYAYLYKVHYADIIMWPNDTVDIINAIYLSVANAFTLTYGGFSPLTQEARVVFMTELFNTFFFFSILITNSVPALNED